MEKMGTRTPLRIGRGEGTLGQKQNIIDNEPGWV